ncbi:peptidoglycan DD-metalloendopeptidase family protein [Siminovitchia sp. 179-K 8D1 HS]|uniref:peptidoglycan DD-metalloendopeptidase family protein n=1 Tax=Siminovitchia sp. 179-K 8D1 HS TaxID=3142385 RepID=UPI0039A26BDE
MNHRANQIKKRIAKRRKSYDRKRDNSVHWPDELMDNDIMDEHSIYDSKNHPTFHPLWNREVFIFKVLASITLVLLVSIIYKSESPAFQEAKSVVNRTMETEFRFAAVSEWYENRFGKPLALFPVKDKTDGNIIQTGMEKDYALPVGAKIKENFSHDGRGVMIETEDRAQVEAIAGGVVIFAGKKTDTGNTVIVQHEDDTESWYAHLNNLTVKPHERIKVGKVLGTVSSDEEGYSGKFYFAIKKGDDFINPLQVINIE